MYRNVENGMDMLDTVKYLPNSIHFQWNFHQQSDLLTNEQIDSIESEASRRLEVDMTKIALIRCQISFSTTVLFVWFWLMRIANLAESDSCFMYITVLYCIIHKSAPGAYSISEPHAN